MKLTTKIIDGLEPGRTVYDDIAPGLVFRSSAKGKGSWGYRYQLDGARREKSLKGYPKVSLARAREQAHALAAQVRAGIDPVAERKAAKVALESQGGALTFEKAARLVHGELLPGWKNAKHAAQWISTLETYVFPAIGSKKLDAITPADCADALREIWLDKAETASRTRQRMHAVMQWAWAHGHITANPVSVVDHILPRQNARKEHQPAVPWRDVPKLVKAHVVEFKQGEATRAALLFLMLTAARSGEVRGAVWGEFDLDSGIWTIPAERMKAKEAHRVALSGQALQLVKSIKEQKLHATLVFPSPRGKVLSDMVLTSFLRRVEAKSDTPGRVATAHGFRSSFRDWASESGYARDLAERALAHAVSNKVEAAYHRTDLLEQRRPMMEAWASHVFSKVRDKQRAAAQAA
ncbi:tyrosine-type recombinase/integrase [Paraburkholderia nemoris]|uniref:tyrosine-type recombinase/integrase n=1 Tax=Paraburkholderia nemoris TaxID=2793076 RepID=UPI0038B84C62